VLGLVLATEQYCQHSQTKIQYTLQVNDLLFITHFNTIVSTFRDWFRRRGIRPCDYLIVPPHSPVTAQILVARTDFVFAAASVRMRPSFGRFACSLTVDS